MGASSRGVSSSNGNTGSGNGHHFKKLYRYRPMARMMQISTMSNTKFRVERICSTGGGWGAVGQL